MKDLADFLIFWQLEPPKNSDLYRAETHRFCCRHATPMSGIQAIVLVFLVSRHSTSMSGINLTRRNFTQRKQVKQSVLCQNIFHVNINICFFNKNLATTENRYVNKKKQGLLDSIWECLKFFFLWCCISKQINISGVRWHSSSLLAGVLLA